MTDSTDSNSLILHVADDNGEIDKFNTLRISSSKTEAKSSNSPKFIEINAHHNSQMDDSDDQISEHIAELQSLFPSQFAASTTYFNRNELLFNTKQQSVIW
eukprot:392585_1